MIIPAEHKEPCCRCEGLGDWCDPELSECLLRTANERLEKERLDWKMQWAEAHERALQAHRQLLTTEKELAEAKKGLSYLQRERDKLDISYQAAEAARLEAVRELEKAQLLVVKTAKERNDYKARLAQVEGDLEAVRTNHCSMCTLWQKMRKAALKGEQE